ncbi:DUF5325 family protein [Oceanobacillus chungangensis]|uniref:DUF5325 family protein n=1 Tax=Oceanobacillus chungangensis TaxID=1229152 RepID=UPI0014731AC4|nr:DUF5325 family protein [Oceanobacillus chungangensis]
MKRVNVPMLLLSMLVIAMFLGVGLSIALRNIWLILIFLILGFSLMSIGIARKKKVT